MHNIIFLIRAFLIFIAYKKAYAVSTEDCIKALIENNKNTPIFATSKDTHCLYVPNGTIKKGTFRIKRTKIEDWDIKVGKMDVSNTVSNVEEPIIENVPMKHNKRVYSITIKNSDSNTIIWTLKDHYFGVIEKVELEVENENGTTKVELDDKKIVLEERKKVRKISKPFADFNDYIKIENDYIKKDNTTENTSNLEKRQLYSNSNLGTYMAMNENGLIWEDISWDKYKDKTIDYKNKEITINDSKYLNAITFYFKKENKRETTHYFDQDFTFYFKIKTSTSKWMIFLGQNNKDTQKISVCYTFDLESQNGENIEVKVKNNKTNTKYYSKLPHDFDEKETYNMILKPKNSYEQMPDITCRNNIIWFVNIAKEENEDIVQTISLKDIYIIAKENTYEKNDNL